MIATRIFKRCSFSDLQKKEKYLSCHATNECSGNERYVMRMSRIQETFPISFPEPALPLSCGTGNERLWDKVFQVDISLAEKKHAHLNRKLKENYFPKSNNRIPVENGGQNTCEVFASTSKSTTRF